MIDIKNWDDEARVSVASDLDDASLPQFESVLKTLMADDRRRIVVDLTECPYISASVVSVLIKGYQQAPESFEVLIPRRGAVHKLFEVCGFIERNFLVRFGDEEFQKGYPTRSRSVIDYSISDRPPLRPLDG